MKHGLEVLMETRFKLWIGALIGAICLAGGSIGYGEADASEKPLTQGEAAMLLVQKLHLTGSGVKPPSPASAIAILMENNITPFGGWMADEPLKVKDVAKILVEALGRSGEISEGERNNADTTAYRDFLIKELGVDLSNIGTALESVPVMAQARGTGVLRDAASTDPLSSRTELGAPDESVGGTPSGGFSGGNLGITEEDLDDAISGGGSGGGGGGGSATTPNTPPPPQQK